ncbi:hypothetical protein [Pseudomonas frederiksbergensis]|uniref:hypothetical protein n=1 Tax=Pseudomonas frederiksbergensis TaxID=104087 RepID=UPI0032E4F18E
MQRTLLGLLFALTVVAPLSAFQLRPEIKNGGKLIDASDDAVWFIRMNSVGAWGIAQYTHPVHESITNRIYGCEADKACLLTTGNSYMQPAAPMAVLAGVRWNDNPPFKLSETSLWGCKNKYVQLPVEGGCWASVFSAGKRNAFAAAKGTVLYKFQPEKSEQYSMLLRSHFGDLQFLHAMASHPGERAGETYDNVMMWAEFTWRIATNEFTRGTSIAEASIEVPRLMDFFGMRETVQSIFFKGEAGYNRDYRDFAFGTLLHMVQDSFSEAHMARGNPSGRLCEKTTYDKPGQTIKFYSYVGQNSTAHSLKDEMKEVTRQMTYVPMPNLIDVGKALKDMKEKQMNWKLVEPYFVCLFRPESAMVKADNGGF